MFALILQIFLREIRIANLVPLIHAIRECDSLIFIVILSRGIEKRIKLPRPSDRSRNISFLKKDIFLAVIKFVQFEIKFSRPPGCKFRKLNREKRGVSRTREFRNNTYYIGSATGYGYRRQSQRHVGCIPCWWENEHRRMRGTCCYFTFLSLFFFASFHVGY